MVSWQTDVLGDGYEQHVIDLGADPDGEGTVRATLVRRTVRNGEVVRGAVLYVHGFTDYFFQTELADFFAARGLAFYALDLRKCGRSRLEGQTPHYVSDLSLYDLELDAARVIVADETDGAPLLLVAHSTGGLILPLWLDRLRHGQGGRALGDDSVATLSATGISGMVLNSPWFDLQGAAYLRTIGTAVIRLMSHRKPFEPIKLPPGDAYGSSLHLGAHGEWEFETAWKPITGFPVTYGWMAAIRRAHAKLHRGVDVGVPTLVMHSDKTHFARAWSDKVDRADAVLDVHQIARWAPSLGPDVTDVTVPDGRHDLFLSLAEPRRTAYEAVDAWLHEHQLVAVR